MQILDREPEWFRRGIKEAIYIRQLQPPVNPPGRDTDLTGGLEQSVEVTTLTQLLNESSAVSFNLLCNVKAGFRFKKKNVPSISYARHFFLLFTLISFDVSTKCDHLSMWEKF